MSCDWEIVETGPKGYKLRCTRNCDEVYQPFWSPDPPERVRANCSKAPKPEVHTDPPRCIFLGESKREVECQLCGGKTRMEKVYECHHEPSHGEVTVRRYKTGTKERLHNCLDCKDRQTEE